MGFRGAKTVPLLNWGCILILVGMFGNNSFAQTKLEEAVTCHGVIPEHSGIEPGLNTLAIHSCKIGTDFPRDINDSLRLGGFVWRVTSMSVHLLGTAQQQIPTSNDYAVVTLVQCSGNGGIYGDLDVVVAVAGPQERQVNFFPGVVAHLVDEDDFLCVRTLLQTTRTAHFLIHGYLQRAPGRPKGPGGITTGPR